MPIVYQDATIYFRNFLKNKTLQNAANRMKLLNENMGIIQMRNVAKNPNICEHIEIMAHGFWLMLTLKSYQEAQYQYEILDSIGNTIKMSTITMQCEIIDCQNIAPEVYILNIYCNSKILLGYRLVFLEKRKAATHTTNS